MADRPPRRGSLPIRLELGIAAFAPALGLLAFRIRASPLAWVLLAFAFIGIAVLIYGATAVVKGNPEPFEFDAIEDLSAEILGHIGAYLLPVLVDPSGPTEEMVISAIILALIIHVHVATGRVHVNPLLYLLGLRVYQATANGTAFYLVAHSDVSSWSGSHRCVQIGASVLVERQTPRNASVHHDRRHRRRY